MYILPLNMCESKKEWQSCKRATFQSHSLLLLNADTTSCTSHPPQVIEQPICTYMYIHVWINRCRSTGVCMNLHNMVTCIWVLTTYPHNSGISLLGCSSLFKWKNYNTERFCRPSLAFSPASRSRFLCHACHPCYLPRHAWLVFWWDWLL